MKKMIPVYLIQLGILAAVLVIGITLMREVRYMRAELQAERDAITNRTAAREPLGAPAIRVRIVGGVYVENEPLRVDIRR